MADKHTQLAVLGAYHMLLQCFAKHYNSFQVTRGTVIVV